MKHFLAYGNSDQASFRSRQVQKAMDYLTVPGTIAAYYPGGTAAFVLTSKLDYIIDPRVPLFQGQIPRPKASHYSLGRIMGRTVAGQMADEKARHPVSFNPELYTNAALGELVQSVVGFQRGYGEQAAQITTQLDRYSRLAALALGEAPPEQTMTAGKAPSFVLSPYFAAIDLTDVWWAKTKAIWAACSHLEDPETISPVVALRDIAQFAQALGQLPADLAEVAFFWLTGFDEHKAQQHDLESVWQGVASVGAPRKLVNLYGGFFSICMAYAGLWGFNNGLGYSESRDWPDLPATGAAPARYYLPRLHMFITPAVAQLIIQKDQTFACICPVCAGRNNDVVALSYEELKRHFALARQEEIDLVANRSKTDVADTLVDAAQRFQNAIPLLPRLRIDVGFLRRWADVLRAM